MKTAENKTKEGILFDRELQVWTECGVILNCAHASEQSNCCNSRRYRGRILDRVKQGIER